MNGCEQEMTTKKRFEDFQGGIEETLSSKLFSPRPLLVLLHRKLIDIASYSQIKEFLFVLHTLGELGCLVVRALK
ncbi:hypothetical protein TNCV_560931 [Trichonephila clavipes]|nr:hypothetical protein TNCV_560931 [Trichonephila clavipes]